MAGKDLMRWQAASDGSWVYVDPDGVPCGSVCIEDGQLVTRMDFNQAESVPVEVVRALLASPVVALTPEQRPAESGVAGALAAAIDESMPALQERLREALEKAANESVRRWIPLGPETPPTDSYNLNDCMVLTLTEFGATHYNRVCPGLKTPAVAGDVVEIQCWVFAREFGPLLHNGVCPVSVGNRFTIKVM